MWNEIKIMPEIVSNNLLKVISHLDKNYWVNKALGFMSQPMYVFRQVA